MRSTWLRAPLLTAVLLWATYPANAQDAETQTAAPEPTPPPAPAAPPPIAPAPPAPAADPAQAPAEPPTESEPATSPEPKAAKPAPAPAKKREPVKQPAVAAGADAGTKEPLNAQPIPKPAASPAVVATPAPGSPEQKVEQEARVFFEALLSGNARAAVSGCAFPFVLEDRTFQTPQELVDEWAKQLRNRRTDLLQLSGLEILSSAEMEKKYGKPPQRLTSFPWKSSGSYLVVARLSGRTAVAVLRESAKAFRVVAYHD